MQDIRDGGGHTGLLCCISFWSESASFLKIWDDPRFSLSCFEIVPENARENETLAAGIYT